MENAIFIVFQIKVEILSFEIKGDFSKPELIFDAQNKNNQLQYYISEFDYWDGEANRVADEIQKGTNPKI